MPLFIDDRWTDEARKIGCEFSKYLSSFLEKYPGKSLVELEFLLTLEIHDSLAVARIKKAAEKARTGNVPPKEGYYWVCVERDSKPQVMRLTDNQLYMIGSEGFYLVEDVFSIGEFIGD